MKSLGLEEVINTCYEKLDEESVQEYTVPESNREYTKSLSKYVSNKLGYELNQEELRNLKNNIVYLDDNSDVFKNMIKKPSFYAIPGFIESATLIGYLINPHPSFLPLTLSVLPATFLSSLLIFYKCSKSNYWSELRDKININAENGADKIACTSHEFTHYFHNKIDKRMKWSEGLATTIQVDALKDYGFKKESNFSAILELLNYYVHEGGEKSKEFFELLHFCKNVLKSYETRSKKHYNKRIKYIELGMRLNKEINRKVHFSKQQGGEYFYPYTFIENLRYNHDKSLKDVLERITG